MSTEDLEAILCGRDPTTGTRLGSPLVDRVRADGRVVPAVAGFGATFSAPKSLSAWWGLTGGAGLLEAHDLAVQAVLDHLGRFGATTRVRVNGSRQFPDVQGLTMAAFRQATSREDDPQLHTHVVISTKVQAPFGRWYALDARYLKRKQRSLGGLYQSVLRAELTHRYGVAWGPIVNGQSRDRWHAHGGARGVLQAHRADQRSAGRQGRGLPGEGGPGTNPMGARRPDPGGRRGTRAMKTGAALPELFDRWQDEAAELGWSSGRLVAAMSEAAQRPAPTREPATVASCATGPCWPGKVFARASRILPQGEWSL